jgi:hypothetical protein
MIRDPTVLPIDEGLSVEVLFVRELHQGRPPEIVQLARVVVS